MNALKLIRPRTTAQNIELSGYQKELRLIQRKKDEKYQKILEKYQKMEERGDPLDYEEEEWPLIVGQKKLKLTPRHDTSFHDDDDDDDEDNYNLYKGDDEESLGDDDWKFVDDDDDDREDENKYYEEEYRSPPPPKNLIPLGRKHSSNY